MKRKKKKTKVDESVMEENNKMNGRKQFKRSTAFTFQNNALADDSVL